jgi:hypothetical protein
MSFRTIAAGAGMLAAFTLAASATASAQTAGSKASAASTQTRVAKPVHRATKPQREATKARHSRRVRLAARQRHRPRAEVAVESIHRPTARAESAGVVHQQTASARRFREFLTPESFADVANEELRSPRLAAAHFSGEVADPEVAAASATEPVAAAPPAGPPPSLAGDQTTADESANKAPAPVQRDAVQVKRAAPSEKEPDNMSFLRWFFIAWGGVLTFASAVRMAVG